jgi:hypothetical protein
MPSANNNGWATPLTEAEKIEATIGAFSARVEQLEEALSKCRELFSEIRADWSDPRDEIREGWAVIDAALKASTNG